MDDQSGDQNSIQEFVWESAPVGSGIELMNRYTHCALCGSRLHFTHITDFALNLTQELSKCLECGQQGCQITHRLQ